MQIGALHSVRKNAVVNSFSSGHGATRGRFPVNAVSFAILGMPDAIFLSTAHAETSVVKPAFPRASDFDLRNAK
jgi:hypothetical protein